MRCIVLVLVLLSISSCTGKSASADLYAAKEPQEFSKFINAKQMPANPNLTVDKAFINNDYPIEIALYQEHRFFYNLPNLGSGTGRWKYNDGKIELRAKRKIFDMYIEVYGADQNIQELAIQFSDRFGAKTIKMENQNFM
jgi:hypothetical protein